jgi:uroporphyrinogen III methyltransferase/synthase
MAHSKTGKVYIIGAGPGDPGLITVRGREALRQAEAIFYEALVNPVLLREARAEAEIYRLADSAAEISSHLVQLAQAGKIAALLVNGDPLVVGQGGEVVAALQADGVPFEIVPGISSAIAAPAYAGIPVTFLDLARSFTVIGDYNNPSQTLSEGNLDWNTLAASEGTLVFLVLAGQLTELSNRLIEAGKSSATPVALISRGTTWQQQTITGTLAAIAEVAPPAKNNEPSVVVVGEVVALREKLRWWDRPETRPLLGKRVVVTRAREQASSFSNKLIDLGADAIEFPTIQIIEPESYAPMDEAITRLGNYDWIVFTSVNGVDHFFRRMKLAGKDARAFGQAKVCAIGPATAAALEDFNIKADFVPTKYVAESILEELGEVRGKRILLARADVAREALLTGLIEQGAEVEQVTAYRQVIARELNNSPTEIKAADLVKLLEADEIDLVTFTSSNTVKNFATRLKSASPKPVTELLEKTRVACIGPITAGTARELGLRVDLEATEFTIDKLIETMITSFAPVSFSIV